MDFLDRRTAETLEPINSQFGIVWYNLKITYEPTVSFRIGIGLLNKYQKDSVACLAHDTTDLCVENLRSLLEPENLRHTGSGLGAFCNLDVLVWSRDQKSTSRLRYVATLS